MISESLFEHIMGIKCQFETFVLTMMEQNLLALLLIIILNCGIRKQVKINKKFNQLKKINFRTSEKSFSYGS